MTINVIEFIDICVGMGKVAGSIPVEEHTTDERMQVYAVKLKDTFMKLEEEDIDYLNLIGPALNAGITTMNMAVDRMMNESTE